MTNCIFIQIIQGRLIKFAKYVLHLNVTHINVHIYQGLHLKSC